MKKAKKDDNPFVGKYSQEQVAVVEASSYVILLDGDLFYYEGQCTFTKNRAQHYHDRILEGLLDLIKKGNEKEQEDAAQCLCFLKIMPLRIQ